MRYCKQCGGEVPTYKREFAYTSTQDGKPVTGASRVGKYSGSIHMNRIDPKHHFCTMRCAARFGVACADGMKTP